MCFLLTAPPQLTFAVAVDFNRASNSGFHVSHTQNQSHCPSLETPAQGSWCALLRGLASVSVSSPTLSPLFFQPRMPELLSAVVSGKPQYSPFAFRFSNPWWTTHPPPHYMSTFIGMYGTHVCIVYVCAYVSVSGYVYQWFPQEVVNNSLYKIISVKIIDVVSVFWPDPVWPHMQNSLSLKMSVERTHFISEGVDIALNKGWLVFILMPLQTLCRRPGPAGHLAWILWATAGRTVCGGLGLPWGVGRRQAGLRLQCEWPHLEKQNNPFTQVERRKRKRESRRAMVISQVKSFCL